jgi:sugar phosphate isomerase/epimerase
MKILFFCPAWGSSDLPIEVFMEKVKKSGYDGVEIPVPMPDSPLRVQILKAIKSRGLEFVAQHYETANPDPDVHLAEYCHRLENLVGAKPMLVNSQTGKDWFSFEQNNRLIKAAQSISEKSGVRIIHETHRGKFSFNAQTTAKYLEVDSALRIAADFSHWCVVSESLLEDQPEAVSLAISHADHIHARIGYPEGPQISDPRAPEWKHALDAHLGWWDRIVECHKKKKTPALTITPEFGPAPYMPTLPYTGMPVASQWDVNVYMMGLLRERYRLGQI